MTGTRDSFASEVRALALARRRTADYPPSPGRATAWRARMFGGHRPPLQGLLQEPDRHRVAIEFSIARLDGGDDDEDRVQDPKDGQEKEADQDEAEDGRHHI